MKEVGRRSCNYLNRPKQTCGMGSFSVDGKASYAFGGNLTVDGGQKSWAGIGIAIMDKK